MAVDLTKPINTDTYSDVLAQLRENIQYAVSGGASKNLIINGTFDEWRRGTSFANPAGYTADRFDWIQEATGDLTISRDTLHPSVAEAGGAVYFSMKIQPESTPTILSNSFYALSYRMIGYDFRSIYLEDFTLSFDIYATASTGDPTGTYTVAFRDQSAAHSYVSEFDIDAADTWQKISITVPSYSSGNFGLLHDLGIEITWTFASGSTYITATPDTWGSGNYIATTGATNGMNSDFTFYLTNITLVKGSIPLDYEIPDVYERKRNCNFYFRKSYNEMVAPGTATYEGQKGLIIPLTAAGTDTTCGSDVSFDAMRVPPTVTTYDSNGTSGKLDALGGAEDSTVSNIGETGFIVSGGDDSDDQRGIKFHYTADAELT